MQTISVYTQFTDTSYGCERTPSVFASCGSDLAVFGFSVARKDLLLTFTSPFICRLKASDSSFELRHMLTRMLVSGSLSINLV